MTISRHDADRMTFEDVTDERLPAVHPGEVLLEDFMKPLSSSARALARDFDAPANRITEIINAERSVSARTALLLATRFDTSAEFWMNLQTGYDLKEAREHIKAAQTHVSKSRSLNSPDTTGKRPALIFGGPSSNAGHTAAVVFCC